MRNFCNVSSSNNTDYWMGFTVYFSIENFHKLYAMHTTAAPIFGFFSETLQDTAGLFSEFMLSGER